MDQLTGVVADKVRTDTTGEAGETPVEVNERGFIKDLSQWTPGVALFLARRQGLDGWPRELTDDHWRVIDYTRAYYHYTRTTPSLQRTCAEVGLTKKQFSRLFPGGLTTVRRISGLPGPRRCARGRSLSKGQQLLACNWWERLISTESQDGGKGVADRLPSTSHTDADDPSRSMESRPAHVAMEFIWTLGQAGRSPRLG